MIPGGSFLIYSLYEVFSVPLYIRLIWVLCSNKDFNTPFFRMLAVIGVCEIVHYIVDVVFYRLPMFGPTAHWFSTEPSRWLSLFGPWAVYFFNHPVYFLQVAISVNRLTSVWWPIKYKMWWKRMWLPLVGISILCSFAFTAHRLPFNATAQFKLLIESDPTSGYTPLVAKYDYYFIDQSILTIAYNSTVLILSVVINTATLWKILAMQRAGTLQNSAATAAAEINLFVICVWMMLTMLVVIFYQICNFMARYGIFYGMDTKYALYTVYLYQPVVDDLGSMSHPWVLLFMCGALRKAAVPFLGRLVCKCSVGLKRKRNEVTSTISVTNVQPTMVMGRQLATVQ